MTVTAEPRLGPGASTAGSTPGERPWTPAEGIERRAIEAMLRCIARHGLGKTTIDDVAREAGCARATLYRYFGGKRALVQATLASETARVTAQIRAAGEAASTLEDAVVALLGTATRELRDHAALAFILEYEPELLLPHVTFTAGDRFLAAFGAALAPALECFVGPGRDARAGEWIARIVLAYALSPSNPTDLTDDGPSRELVREFVLPGLVDRRPQPSERTRG
jgi:AcrR family transcriptional regulator